MRFFSLLALLLASTAHATHPGCYSTVATYVPPYQQTTYVQAQAYVPPTYAALVPLPLFVTPYAAGYLPQASAVVTQLATTVAAPVHDCKADMKALNDKFEAFKSGFAAAQQPQPTQSWGMPRGDQQQPQRQMSYAARSTFTEQDAQEISGFISANCLKCHNANKAEKGIRLDVEITLPVAIKCQSQVAAGLMPPGTPMRDKTSLFEKLTARVCETTATAGR